MYLELSIYHAIFSGYYIDINIDNICGISRCGILHHHAIHRIVSIEGDVSHDTMHDVGCEITQQEAVVVFGIASTCLEFSMYHVMFSGYFYIDISIDTDTIGIPQDHVSYLKLYHSCDISRSCHNNKDYYPGLGNFDRYFTPIMPGSSVGNTSTITIYTYLAYRATYIHRMIYRDMYIVMSYPSYHQRSLKIHKIDRYIVSTSHCHTHHIISDLSRYIK